MKLFKFLITFTIYVFMLNLSSEDLILKVNEDQNDSIILTKYFSVLEDKTNKLNFNDIVSESYSEKFLESKSSGNSLNFGITNSSYWLRLKLKNDGNEKLKRFLEVSYANLSKIEFYKQKEEGVFEQIITGNTLGYETRPYKNRYFIFPITLKENTTEVYYFKIDSIHMLIPAKLWKIDSYHNYEKNDYTFQALYFGITIAMIVFNLLIYISTKDKIYLYYVVLTFFTGLSLANNNGFVKEFIPLNSEVFWKNSVSFLFTISLISFIFLLKNILNTKIKFPKINYLLNVLVIYFFITLISFQFLPRLFTVSARTISVILFLLIIIYAVLKKERSAYFLLIAYLFLFAGSLATGLWGLGILPTNIFTINGFQIGSVLEMMLLAFALADRYNILKQEKLKVQEELVKNLKESEHILEIKVEERTTALTNTLNKIYRDINTAKKIQTSILPKLEKFKDELELHTIYLPMSEVGGDIFDIHFINKKIIRFFIADATGHGIQASLITMAIKTIYDSLKNLEIPPNEVLEILNNQFINSFQTLKTYFTGGILDLNLESKKISYSGGGHPYPILIKNDKTSLNLKTRGTLVGAIENFKFGLIETDFKDDFELFIFTDGIFEEWNDKMEEFGVENLEQELSIHDGSLHVKMENILNKIFSFMQNQPVADDITFIGVKLKH